MLFPTCLAEVACSATAVRCDSHAKHGSLRAPQKHIPSLCLRIISWHAQMQSKYSHKSWGYSTQLNSTFLPACVHLAFPTLDFSYTFKFLLPVPWKPRLLPLPRHFSASVLPRPRVSNRDMYDEAIKVRSSRRDPAPDPRSSESLTHPPSIQK